MTLIRMTFTILLIPLFALAANAPLDPKLDGRFYCESQTTLGQPHSLIISFDQASGLLQWLDENDKPLLDFKGNPVTAIPYEEQLLREANSGRTVHSIRLLTEPYPFTLEFRTTEDGVLVTTLRDGREISCTPLVGMVIGEE